MAEKSETPEIITPASNSSLKEAEKTVLWGPDFPNNTPDILHNQIVGFGKHKTLTFHQLASIHKGYVDWLFSQTWFNCRYPELYEYLTAIGLCPKSSKSLGFHSDENKDDLLGEVQTHDELQARFTDNDQLLDLIKKALGSGPNITYNICSVIFEHWCGADIKVLVQKISTSAGIVMNSTTITNYTLLIELKPSVSNDYPEILRQIRGQEYSYNIFRKQTGPLVGPGNIPWGGSIIQLLVTQRYDGNIPLETVKKIFGCVQIVFIV